MCCGERVQLYLFREVITLRFGLFWLCDEVWGDRVRYYGLFLRGLIGFADFKVLHREYVFGMKRLSEFNCHLIMCVVM